MQDHSTCFGRFLYPSSGVLKTVVAATGAYHGSGWHISSKDVQGLLSTALCHSLFRILPKLHLVGSLYNIHKVLLSYIDSWRQSCKIRVGWSGNPAGTNGLSLLHTSPDGHEAHLVSCTIDIGAHYRGPRPDIDHPPLSIVEVKEIVYLYKYSPSVLPISCYGLTFTFTFKYADDPEVSQTTAVMNTEMRSTRATWAAKVYKVCPRC